ncbi:hypothetical protein CVT24_011699 [Panaeolus cyanescens]|uniref:L-tryptophan decarboxylase PsiD-like domain-containing protein n=1 Tax=Panaeolus cyanescens TaxID=181874 RepID=A0A409YHB4_9AGAR|nr:hypothetical protein CVT24_011699 [Panaeolus cyanescens]
MSIARNKVHRSYRKDEGAKELTRYRGWLPESPAVHRQFVRKHHEHGKEAMRAGSPHNPAVERFGNAIKADSVMLDLFHQAILQSSRVPDSPAIESLDHFLHQLDMVVSSAPCFHVATDDDGNTIGEVVGVPIFLLFDLMSNTQAGYDLLRMQSFNAAMKDLLNSWGSYLAKPASASVLNNGPEGWFGPAAMKSLESNRGRFDYIYVEPDPGAPHKGYRSWDDFFTRALKEGARPLLGADDPTIIHNACESAVFQLQRNVQLHDRFWLKAQPYSLYDIMNRDENDALKFVGGTVYQAFLSPQDYHRWHSPVSGTIKKALIVPGTYYAALPDNGAPPDDPDLKPGDPHGALMRSQGWLTLSSARALIFIEADNPAIGLMCFVGVGMTEVSTCDITVQPGDHVSSGEQLGMFHFGGSSHALIFGPQAKLTFADVVQKDRHLHINIPLARVQKEPRSQD